MEIIVLLINNLDMKEKLILAAIICQNFAQELDSGIKTNITHVVCLLS